MTLVVGVPPAGHVPLERGGVGSPDKPVALLAEGDREPVLVDRGRVARRGPLEIRARRVAIGEPRWPAGQEPLRALRSLWKRIGARVDDDERPHSLRVTRGEVDRVEATHGVTDDGRALDAELIEHGKCIRHEVAGCVAACGPPTLALAA